MNLYAFLNRFGSWSTPFLAHTDEEAQELIKASLKGKQLSYSDQKQDLYRIAFYRIDAIGNPLDNVVECVGNGFVCSIDDLAEQGCIYDAEA